MTYIKKIIKLILITLVILSAFMATNVFAITTPELSATAIEQKVTPELDSVQNNVDSMNDKIIESWEYRNDYDMFCSQRGVKVWDIDDDLDNIIKLSSDSGSKTIDVGYIYKENDEYDAAGYTSFIDNKSIRAIYEITTVDEDGNPVSYPKIASPQEAYILSEMFNNTDEHKNRPVVGFEEKEEEKTEVEIILGGGNLEDYYLFSITEGDNEVKIYEINDKYWIYREGFLIPIIISEDEISDAVNYTRSYVQKAWWRTDESDNVQETDGGEFSVEAQAFEEYILDITGKENPDDLEYVEQEYEVIEQFEDGSTKVSTGKVVAPKIEYTPEWKDIGKTQEVSWDAENGRYLVGPFAIDYYTQADDIISEFKFAGIESSKITSNLGDLDLDMDNALNGKEYTFLHADGSVNNSYPAPDSEFYIVIPYIEGLKELQNIEFKFIYMNAGGEFNKYKGTGYTETWGIVGDKVKKIKEETHDLQDMVEGIKAARWYETAELKTSVEIQTIENAYGDLKVVKNVVDSEGNAIIVEKDKVFEFEVTIKRKVLEKDEEGKIQVDSNGDYKIIIEEVKQNVAVTVPEGQSTSSVILPTEVWEKVDGNSEILAPEYVVKEINPSSVEIENHTYVATENPAPTGKFKENAKNTDTEIFEGAVVTIKNIYDGKVNTGKIRIIKEVVDEEGNPKAVKTDSTFKFAVTVGGEYQEVSITVPKGTTSASWTSGEYTWKMSEEAPAYSVDEIDAAGYEKVDVIPKTGNLSADDVVTVVRINRYKSIIKKGYIRVIKELVDENGNPKAAERDESFKFNVYINNELKFEPVLIINEGQTKTNIWTSDPIEWKEDESNPTYKVEEELPITSSFGIYEIINESGNIVESSPELSQLVAVKNTKEKIENSGKIKIIKEIVDETGKLINVDNDTTFNFNLVTYYEKAEGKEIIEDKDVEVTVPAGSSSGSWELETLYKWEDNAPKYEIKEIEVPENYEFVKIINKNEKNMNINTAITGSFENSETVIVRATNKTLNKEEHEGKLIIVKKTVDAKGKAFIADKDYVFEFKVEVEGNVQTVTLRLPKGASEVTSDPLIYKWEGNVSPTYKVTETKSNGFTPNITNATGSLVENSEGNTTVIAINSKGEEFNKGKVQITKHVSGPRPTEGPITFKFDLYITYDNRETKEQVEITLNGDEPVAWTSDYYYWNVDENAPRYRVVEIDNGGYQDTTIKNDNGYLENEKTIPVDVYNMSNEVEYEKGELQIAKILTDGTNKFTGKSFEFEVWVEGYGTETITVEAGNSWSKEYTWIKGEKVPEYRVKEKNASGYNIFSGASGSLEANNTVVVEAINTFNYENSGNIEIQKTVIVEDKIDNAEFANIPFKFKVTIYYDNPNEYFVYNGKAYNSIEIFKEVTPDCGIIGETSGTYDSFDNPEIKVYFEKVDNAPKYVVEEIYAPVGWKLISAENEEGKIQKDAIITASFTNKLPVERKYIFTMEMGGIVWNDTNYSNGKPLDSQEDGKKAETEAGMPNVIVKIFNTDKTEAEYTLVTDGNGKWCVPNMPVPYNESKDSSASYYVTYTYDGQTYEPTKSLANGNVANFVGGNNTDRKAYLDNSMAIEDESERNEFNKEFETIEGGSPIDGNGNTVGSTGKGVELNYKSNDVEYNGYVKRNSDLITLNSDGTAKYPMTASTANLGLYYPFDRKTALVSTDREILEGIPTISYTYHAAYPYLNNVNMGLVERPFADVSIEKELEEAVVVVNGKLYKYKYGEIANTQFAENPDLLYKQIQINQRNINYTLNLYQSDYYYRASVYQGDNGLWTALESKYIDVSEELDLDVYLKYKLVVTNESDSYYVRINQISDYVDSSLELVTTNEEKFIDNIKGNEESKVVVAKAPSHTWTQAGTYHDTTDGWKESSPIKYTRYIANTSEILGSGEELQLDLTFKVKNSLDTLETGVGDCVILGDKNNIAEIDSYSTYYDAAGNKVAGRVDEDSAPGNINFSKNMVNWYEDDTDKAPTIKLGLYDVVRNVEGIVWEDEETKDIQYNQMVGNGLFESTENTIGNMTTKLVEKVTVGDKDFDFIWPTGDNIESSRFTLGGKTIYELTGFDSEILTSNDDTTKGKYNFTGVPAGNYVVRFIYGDENTLDLNVRDDKGNIKYSGQDYKSSTYQVGNIVNNVNPDGYINNEFHDLANEELKNTRVSDARDDESRRLEVISKSQELFYENTSIMDTNTSSYGINNENGRVFDDSLDTYYMIANTAKLNMNIESKLDAKAAITEGKVTSVGGVDVNVLNANLKTANSIKVTRIVYNVNNIDFGLESRSENNIKLDKQIEQITLKTSAGDILIDAKYNIDYNSDGTAIVELDRVNSIGVENLQALNKTPGDLGFRYLNVDKDVLQGATITINYRITALNTGEVDRCATLLKGITDFNAAINDLRLKYHNKDYTSGTYLGQIYYQGATIEDSSKDEVVETKVKQVIDYVDNDVIFSQAGNTGVNASWSNISTVELSSDTNRLINKNIIDSASGKILDSNGVAYEADSKNNIIVSVENADNTAATLANPNLMKELTPYEHTDGTEHKAHINVTVSRYYSSDMDIEEVENIAETLKLYNDVGRRDLRTVQGNTRPAAGAIDAAFGENDSTATELITLSPPTGMVTTAMLVLQIMAIVLVAITILAGGIVIIKKKVLIK